MRIRGCRQQIHAIRLRAISAAVTLGVALVAVVLATGAAQAQNYRVLHAFSGGADGGQPMAGLMRDSTGNLYGTTEVGGTMSGPCATAGCGVVFKLDSTGSETVLHTFTGGADGRNPLAGLIRDSAGNLYGTTSAGGLCSGVGCGVVFKLDPTTGKETVLYRFTGGADGAFPQASLFLDDAGILYGTTPQGGVNRGCGGGGCGVVFSLDPMTGEEKVLYTFTGGADGGEPVADLIRDSAGNFYSTASLGGIPEPCGLGCGVVFKLDSTGKETVLYTFTDGADGGVPVAGLIRDSIGNLYGTTEYGGAPGWGVVFKLAPTGKETVLHTFTGGADGATPIAGLVRDVAGNLYGTAYQGGTGTFFTDGVVFKLDSTGKEAVLHTFNGKDGANPYDYGRLVRDSAGNLYGTTSQAGASGYGVVFKLTLPNFKITGSPTSATVSPGQSTTSTLTLTPVAGFRGTVSLGCTVPSGDGLSCGVSPTSVTLSGTNSAKATLSIRTSSTTPAGTYSVKAKGTSGMLVHSTTFRLTVQ
jgi:uncharacterized repeat protein (TIGR03803 family)